MFGRVSDFCSYCELPVNATCVKHKSQSRKEDCRAYVWDNDMKPILQPLLRPFACSSCSSYIRRCGTFCSSTYTESYLLTTRKLDEFREDLETFQRQLLFEIWAVNQLRLNRDIRQYIIRFIRRPVEFNASSIYRKKKRNCCCNIL
jgi:hypothetical protein